MIWIFRKNIIYKTKLTKEKIIDRLNNNFQYDGYVSDDYFFIERYVDGKAQTIPQIKGVYHETDDGTTINVVMKIKKPILIFMTLWLTGISFVCAITITSMIINVAFDDMSIPPFGMLIIGIAILVLPFEMECRQSKKHLQKMFKAEIIK